MSNAEALFPALEYAPSALAAAEGADVLLLLTEWREYLDLDPADVVMDACPAIVWSRRGD